MLLNARFESAFADIFGAPRTATVDRPQQFPAVAAPSLNAPAAPRADAPTDRVKRTHRTLQRGGGVHTLRGKEEEEVYEAALDLKNSIDIYRMPSITNRRVDSMTGDHLVDVTYKSMD